MMEMAKVTSKGQITIPISIRRRLGINEGDKLLFISKPDGVMMVNPDMLEGDQAEAIAEAAETAAATPAVAAASAAPAAPVAAIKKETTVASPQAPVRSDESVPAVESIAATESVAAPQSVAVMESPAVTQSPVVTQEVRRPVPPPVYEPEPEKPEARVGGLDLSTLLDDIRSIGSNI